VKATGNPNSTIKMKVESIRSATSGFVIRESTQFKKGGF